jgi:lipid II:glycine glycyltransferase (peptidoglycan interpeptide bridge formation enzyme)
VTEPTPKPRRRRGQKAAVADASVKPPVKARSDRGRVRARPAIELPPLPEPSSADSRPEDVSRPAARQAAVETAKEPAEERAEVARGPISAHLATPEELEDWDAHAVASPTGHVYQSRAWAEYRAAHGWQTWHLVFDDGFRLLVLGRPRSVTGGGSAYASRGPIPEAHAELSAQRAVVAADLLACEAMDDLVVDGETPAGTGLGHLLQGEGFEPTEELQPSRHRMDVQLGPDDFPNSDEKTIFASFGADTRYRIRQTERHGLRVKRLDAGGGRADEAASASLVEEFETVDHDDASTVDGMLRTFYGMLDATAERRGFVLASEDRFLDWAKRSLAVGHMFYLQAEHPQDGPLAGATFYRHGHRLTYALAGDRAELRRTHPGAVRLLVWRAIQIALDENRTIVDLGGVDVEGARSRPNKGDSTYGMYEFKESFGARWVELTGAHRKTMRPMRNLAGRVLGRLAALRR